MATSKEDAKLQQHIELLREQYMRLQQKYTDLEQKYSRIVTTSGDVGPDHIVTRFLSLVSRLYEKPLYSDIKVQLSDKVLPAHKMILCARSNSWCPNDEDLVATETLDLSHLTSHVANIMLRWVYTDAIAMPSNQTDTIELLSAANAYKLTHLKEKCEETLISNVTVRNCIKLYQTSEEYKAQQLRDYCLKVISSRWNDLNTDDFADLSAPLLYEMFKVHSNYPLHLAIQHLREDVVFMFIIEHNLQLSTKLSELDDNGNSALDLALLMRQEAIANTLVTNKCDINVRNRDGHTPLHLAITRGDTFAATFLIRHGASTTHSTHSTDESPLHLAAKYNQSEAAKRMEQALIKQSSFPSNDMAGVAELLLQHEADPDKQDRDGYTPIMRAVVNSNREVFTVLLSNKVLDLELSNNDGSTVLWLALQLLDSTYLTTLNDEGASVMDEETFAAKLVGRGANMNAQITPTGDTLLHRASLEGNESAAVFLVRHGAGVDCTNHKGEAPIHIAASMGLHHLAQVLLKHKANPNLLTDRIAPPTIAKPLTTPSITTPFIPNVALGDISAISSLVSDSSRGVAVGVASNPFDPTGFASLQELSSIGTHPPQGTRPSYPSSLADSTNPFGDDSDDETPPTSDNRPLPLGGHTPSPAQIETTPTIDGDSVREFIDPPHPYDITIDQGARSALHIAVVNRRTKVVDTLLTDKDSSKEPLLISVSDGSEETALSLALWTGQFEMALKLLDAGADIECCHGDRVSLVYQSLVREQSKAALFLLNNGADFKRRTHNNETLLMVAIRHQLEDVADRLCDVGSEVGVADASGNSALWVALRSRQKAIASKLVSHGCDPNAWHTNGTTTLSLLHRAIQLGDNVSACFLIKSGADVITPAILSDGSSLPPLHMSCQRGLCVIVQCLVDHHAEINAKDSEGRTALHTSILSKHADCSAILLSQPRIDLTIKDAKGHTPFAVAMATKDNETGRAILEREPDAAEQMDNKGLNFLHHAVLNKDVESVIFLLSVAVNINSVVKNPTCNTPLHFAVKNGSEILVRHLLLAGADVSAVDNHDRGVLHMAVEGDYSNILSVLIESSAIVDHVDEEGNNALHCAMMLGRENCVRVLLEDSNVNLGTTNIHGRNCLHMLAATPRDNAAVTFEMLMRVAPNYPLDRQDSDGNTPLLLAYVNGNTGLCDSLMQYCAHPGMANRQSLSIFNAPVATKQLLFRILDQIQKEPQWLEGQHCMDCNTKFNISHRKHHCRHCGRLLCNKCTSQQVPIIKFDLNKPARVCEVCADSFKIREDMR